MVPVVAFGQAGTTQSCSPCGGGVVVVPWEDTPARSVSERYSGLPRGTPEDQLVRATGRAR